MDVRRLVPLRAGRRPRSECDRGQARLLRRSGRDVHHRADRQDRPGLPRPGTAPIRRASATCSSPTPATYFIKGGADSPENFLAYADFDDTYDTDELTREGEAAGGKFIHTYQPHVEDWRPGDPTWTGRQGQRHHRGPELPGLQGHEQRLLSHLQPRRRRRQGRLDVDRPQREATASTAASWTSGRSSSTHMDRLGLMLHVVTQETENDQGLDKGDLGRQRKLYYRELIARFAHHPAVVWNLGEENTNTPEQRKAFARYIHELDPYDHPVVCHTYPRPIRPGLRAPAGIRVVRGPLAPDERHARADPQMGRPVRPRPGGRGSSASMRSDPPIQASSPIKTTTGTMRPGNSISGATSWPAARASSGTSGTTTRTTT